jgi:hypothetical protein
LQTRSINAGGVEPRLSYVVVWLYDDAQFSGGLE